MTIEKGDIYGFVGENGSGKTTIIRLITGLISAKRGGEVITVRYPWDADWTTEFI